MPTSKPLTEKVFVDATKQDEGAICTQCILDVFQKAYDSETDPDLGWGVRWGSDHLRARNYIAVLGEEFVIKYERREAEYNVPRKDRVYCSRPTTDDGQKCGGFIGAATSATGNGEANCPTCNELTCLICRKAHLADGICSGPPEDEETLDDGFSEMERGIHYQRCPGCRTGYAHLDGCNWTKCAIMTCGKGFCFLCGKEAIHQVPYDHWQRLQPDGSVGCALWGREGANPVSNPYNFHIVGTKSISPVC